MALRLGAGGGSLDSSLNSINLYTVPVTTVKSTIFFQLTVTQKGTNLPGKLDQLLIQGRGFSIRENLSINPGYSHPVEPFVLMPGETLVAITNDPNAQFDIVFSYSEQF